MKYKSPANQIAGDFFWKRVKILKTNFTNGQLEIKLVQPEGKTSMPYEDFQKGYGKIIQKPSDGKAAVSISRQCPI